MEGPALGAWICSISSFHHSGTKRQQMRRRSPKQYRSSLSLFLLQLVKSLVIMHEGLQLFTAFHSLQVEGKFVLGLFDMQWFYSSLWGLWGMVVVYLHDLLQFKWIFLQFFELCLESNCITILELILFPYEVAVVQDLRLFHECLLYFGFLLSVHRRGMGHFGKRGEFFMHGRLLTIVLIDDHILTKDKIPLALLLEVR